MLSSYLKHLGQLTRALVITCGGFVLCITPQEWAESAGRMEGLVVVNGIRLQYLDWGGSGPALILIHGIADNPYSFDDLAPALTDRFHVVAYARRGSGESDAVGPFDVETLTEDLRGVMDALGIAKAALIGVSAGGDEVTQMAATEVGVASRRLRISMIENLANQVQRHAVLRKP